MVQYPSGSTVLECQFEADRPVARIVQVPAAVTDRDGCLLVKKKSSSDSRMASQRKDVKKQRVRPSDSCQKRTTDKFIFPTACTLKSYDPTDGSLALADKVQIASSILGADKDKKQLDSSSKMLAKCSSSKNILKEFYCGGKSSKQPMTFIECATTPKGPLTRVTQCSTKTKDGGTNYYIYLGKSKKDSSHKLIPSVTDSAKRTIPDKKADLKIDILVLPEMKGSLSQVTRKDGLEIPSEVPYSLKKPSKRSKTRIRKTSCQAIQPAAKDSSDILYAKSSDAKASPIKICTTQKHLDAQQFQRLASEQRLQTEIKRIEFTKSDKAAACQRSAVAPRRTCLTPDRVSEDTLRLPSAQELRARYKGYIPAYQLERYEACRIKRNGLQDECIPPLLRNLLKKEEEQRILEKCSKRERKVDQLCQSGMTIQIRMN
ncbi:uncharacterized protein LOC105834663 [Monomorium pharaonis]|uniref:uncharacterized protein LOC105834663 n=1 Tax=Monomorium pharaonis TaxID=307658 RepID=UPI00063FC988|nr:uncharacterized protein LOC105834663 [Monomorium pharaonis]